MLDHVVQHADERLRPAGFGRRDIDPVRADVRFAQVRGDGGVGGGRRHVEVGEEAEDEILAPLNVLVTPRHGGPELEGDAWDRVFHPRRLDRTGLSRVDLDDVRLGEGGEAGVVRESVVGVHPHWPVGAGG